MRTVAIINQKGGCGKTTTSINLAACLGRLGQKTLLVDMDPQGHCGVGLAVPEEQIERTIYDALIEPSDGKPSEIGQVIWQIATDFDLAPSSIRLAAFEQVFSHRAGRDERLKLALDKVRSQYQWCIMDCPPSVGLLTFNALKASDEVIVPVETGYFSLHGLAKMMETLEVLRQRCGREILIRILPTLYDTRTKLAREVLSELRSRFRNYLMESTVNFNTKLKEAASFGQPITEYDPGSRGYKDFVNLARELMGQRIAETKPAVEEKLSRPAELVQRAKQLAQLANVQFGRTTMATQQQPRPAMAAGTTLVMAPVAPPAMPPAMPPAKIPAMIPAISPVMTPQSPPPLARTPAAGEAFVFDGKAVEPDPVVSLHKAPPAPVLEQHIVTPIASPTPISVRPAPRVVPEAPLSRLTAGSWPPAPTSYLSGADLMLPNRQLQSISLAGSLGGLGGPISGDNFRGPAEGFRPATPAAPAAMEIKTTQQKIDEFYGVKQIGSEVIFAAHFDYAKSVLLAGDFNNWSPQATPMINGERPGDWRKVLPLAPGRYKYRLVVDGKWITDPNNRYVEANQFGELDNVIEVEKAAAGYASAQDGFRTAIASVAAA